jgi:16S rRNA (cytidine1402-2'-O)-methyltransferase
VAGTLYLVGTPIGNLGDVSDRARRTLSAVALVAAEDTRRTGRLLKELGLSAPLMSFFEGNEERRVPQVLERLVEGEDVALVSDAGMPGLSDPGFRLVAACIEAGVPIDVVPGPSAAVAALVISGLPTDRFVFEGFLPRTGRARRQRLAGLAMEPRTIVVFESPRRVARTLEEFAVVLGDRPAAVVRELTKVHQEVLRGSLSEILEQVKGRELRGEVVVVVHGAPRGSSEEDPAVALADAVRMAADLARGGMRKREAARRAATASGLRSSEIYARLVGDPEP